MKNEASCPSKDVRDLVVAKSREIWNTMCTAIMQCDLRTAQLYTVADNLLNELVGANEMDIDHAVMEMKASIRASLRKEDADIFQLQKQFTALKIVVELLQTIHNGDNSTVWKQQEEEHVYALTK